jgi:toxin ParE1/3/4
VRAKWVAEAEAELSAAAQWYEDRKAGLGEELLSQVVDAFLEIEKTPLRFPPPPNIRTQRTIRRHLLPRFPYSIIYEATETEIRILAVAHVGQRPDYWKKRLK